MGYNTEIELIQGDTPAELTIEEHDLLQHCERIITEGIDTFYDVANALATVNRRKLYRETHSTFEAYCREKWDMGKAQAHRMIDAHDVRENLSPIGDDYPLPEKESHVRALKKAPAEKQPEVWKDLVDSGEPITAKTIEQAVKTVTIDLEERKSRIGKYYEINSKAFKVRFYIEEDDTYSLENVVTHQGRANVKPDELKVECEESYIQSVYLKNTTCCSQCETCQSPCQPKEPEPKPEPKQIGWKLVGSTLMKMIL
jgi:Zn finger protein HypA/HybF involved in hydrogenase expression